MVACRNGEAPARPQESDHDIFPKRHGAPFASRRHTERDRSRYCRRNQPRASTPNLVPGKTSRRTDLVSDQVVVSRLYLCLSNQLLNGSAAALASCRRNCVEAGERFRREGERDHGALALAIRIR